MSNSPADDPIKHVVVLVLENHSFDQMLGCFKETDPDVDGVSPAAPGENRDPSGVIYRQAPTTERQMMFDPHHELEHVQVQLEGGNAGFVKDFVASYPDSSEETRGFIMGYFPRGFLPALHALARDFTICDRWFASVPGPTWPNRFFALTGTSNGRVNMPHDGTHNSDLAGYFQQDQVTVFDRLGEKGRHWKIYFHDIPQSWALTRQRRPENAARYFYIDEFFGDCRGVAEEFPEFSLIEPDFMGVTENDDHPPHDVMKAEKLIADVYNAIGANDALWQSTLLVIFYDEHGGFYDRVSPPAAIPPDAHHQEYGFDRLGVRVPALLISPWVGRRVEHTLFDHTSLLKYLIEKWDLGPLGDRAQQANSIGTAIAKTARDPAGMIARIDITIDQLTAPDPEREEAAWSMASEHHAALQHLGQWLWARIDEGAPRAVVGIARGIEALKQGLDWLLHRLRHQSAALQVTIAEPDKLTRKSARTRDQVARYMMRRKVQAVPALAARIRNRQLGDAQRAHAVHTLALLTRRPLHRERNRIDAASEWLKKVGQ